MSLFDELSDIRKQMYALQKQIEPLARRENDIRVALQKKMQEDDIRTMEGSGLQAIRSFRTTTEITNKTDLESALREAGLYDRCSRLDLNEAKKVGLKHEMPGVAQKRQEIFSIKQVG